MPAPMSKPDYPGPSDFLVLALVVMGICGLLNLTSLLFGIPAVIFAAMVCDFTCYNNYCVQYNDGHVYKGSNHICKLIKKKMFRLFKHACRVLA